MNCCRFYLGLTRVPGTGGHEGTIRRFLGLLSGLLTSSLLTSICFKQFLINS
jgi:hypothetical protein